MIPKTKIAFGSGRVYTIAAVASLIFLIFGVAFIQYTGQLSKEQTKEYIQVATRQSRYAFDEYVRKEFETLSAATVFFENKNLLPREELVLILSSALSRIDDYVNVGVVDLHGHAVWFNANSMLYRADLSEEPFIKQALAGKEVLTERQKAFFLDEYVYIFAVPIHSNGTVSGVLFASIPEERLHEVLENSMYAGRGFAHVIKDNGDYVLESRSPLRASIGHNIFDISTPFSQESRRELLDNLEGRRSGHLEKHIYQENRLVAYEPLNINGWHLFYVVIEKDVNAGIRLVTTGSAVVVVAAVLVFMLFLALIHQINARSRKALERLAFEDPITGQSNFRKFLLDAETILKDRGDERYALWYGDIDGFKYINDLFGRDTGDALLRYWGRYLAKNLGPGEAAARVNSDIFVSLRRCESFADIRMRIERGREYLSAFPEIAARGYKVAHHCGIYVTNGQDGDLSVEDMVYRANMAQKSIKNSGDLTFAVYSDEMRNKMLYEKEIEQKMEAALAGNEFIIFLQPKVDIQRNDRIMGMEVLVRWESKTKGIIPPSKFIPLFEKNGFIVKLDRYIFEAACMHYRREGFDRGHEPLIMSVNVSRLGLLQPDFIETYARIKESYAIPDGVLELEFTENLVFENDELFRSIIVELRKCGFLCSLDDFGAGYSSLNILRSIHVDVLKLDGLFFRYGQDVERGQELVRNIVAMAKALNMKTVAEGIENEDQVRQLRAMGCDIVQGYVFSRPVPARDFKELVKAWGEVPEDVKLVG